METKYRINIAFKLILGFGLVLIFTLISNLYISGRIEYANEEMQKVTKIYTPVTTSTNDVKLLIINALTQSGTIKAGVTDNKEIKELRNLTNVKYPELKSLLLESADKLDPIKLLKISEIITNTDVLFSKHSELLKINSDSLQTQFIEVKKKSIDSLSRVCEKELEKFNEEMKKSTDNTNEILSTSFGQFSDRLFSISMGISILIIIIALLTGFSLIVPLNKIKNVIMTLGAGGLPTERLKIGSDEIGQMGRALNILIEGLNVKADFARDIGSENYDSDFTPLSKEDVLGNSLLTMRDNLSKASEAAEIRRIENFQRSWSSQGLAEFSEILRKHSDSLESFSSITISKLTKYLDAKVGGLYMLVDEDNDRHLELVSFYAYDRRKFITKRIEIGENLVGQCVLESETIYMTDIPEGYVHISSGLGKDSPRSLLIVPLKLNEEIFGVVEIASFNEFHDYQIDFVEKIGESIASTIANIKISIKTSKLLEDSNEKSKRLAAQEEESRKNIEKLKEETQKILKQQDEERIRHEKLATDYKDKLAEYEKQNNSKEDELAKQINKFENIEKAINNSLGVLHVDFDGRITYANKIYLKITNSGFSDIAGRYMHEFITDSIAGSDEYKKIWSELRYGKVYSGTFKYEFRGMEKWLYETYTPVRDINGRYDRVLVFSTDIDVLIKSRIDVEAKIEEKPQENIEDKHDDKSDDDLI